MSYQYLDTVVFTCSVESMLSHTQSPLDLNPTVENDEKRNMFKKSYHSPLLDLNPTVVEHD